MTVSIADERRWLSDLVSATVDAVMRRNPAAELKCGVVQQASVGIRVVGVATETVGNPVVMAQNMTAETLQANDRVYVMFDHTGTYIIGRVGIQLVERLLDRVRQTSGSASVQYTNSGTSFVAVDSTNLRLSFIGPPNGWVRIKMWGFGAATGINAMYWALMDTTSTVITGSSQKVMAGAGGMAYYDNYYAVLPGVLYQWDWAWKSAGGVNSLDYGTDDGILSMEAWATVDMNTV